ncbi:hypothetical protein ACFQX6_37800 [Streptosporangium lutulentum]
MSSWVAEANRKTRNSTQIRKPRGICTRWVLRHMTIAIGAAAIGAANAPTPSTQSRGNAVKSTCSGHSGSGRVSWVTCDPR